MKNFGKSSNSRLIMLLIISACPLLVFGGFGVFAGIAMFCGLNDDSITVIDTEAELIAFTKDAAVLDGFEDAESFSENYHALEFLALNPEKMKNKEFTVWVSPSFKEGENDEKFWTSKIGKIYSLKIREELVGNEDYPCVFTCSKNHLKENNLTANQSVGQIIGTSRQ